MEESGNGYHINYKLVSLWKEAWCSGVEGRKVEDPGGGEQGGAQCWKGPQIEKKALHSQARSKKCSMKFPIASV